MIPKISVVMPVLNEAGNIGNTLGSLYISDNEELIVVDGGSSDATMSIARRFTDRVFETKTGRASVMNYGAQKAEGEILLFLHADCILPDNAFSVIREALSSRTISSGAFLLGISHPGFGFRIIESAANLRSRITRLLYGDQGMFMRREVFERIGGFADVPLMEDIEISRRLKKEGEVVLVHPAIKASPRRWLSEGMVYTTLRDWYIAFRYTFLKAPSAKLIRHYRDVR